MLVKSKVKVWHKIQRGPINQDGSNTYLGWSSNPHTRRFMILIFKLLSVVVLKKKLTHSFIVWVESE